MTNTLTENLSFPLSNPLAAFPIRIVLVEPAGSMNLGSAARIMKNMGLSELVLVKPHCQPTDEDAQNMAVHADDVLAAARQVPSIPDALVGCQRAVATIGRDRTTLDMPFEPPRQVLPWLLGHDIKSSNNSDAPPVSALIFGPEDRGLSTVELNYAQRCLTIPTSPVYPSLNLAQAIAICCYELHQIALAAEQSAGSESSLHDQTELPRQDQIAAADFSAYSSEPEATLDALEGYYQHLESLLLTVEYLYPHTAESRMKKLRRLFNRAHLSESEVSMLRGVLRQMNWALKNPSKLDGLE
ncbi:MAG: RNA methyltransferase [Elainellaceae cyanobacterium]